MRFYLANPGRNRKHLGEETATARNALSGIVADHHSAEKQKKAENDVQHQETSQRSEKRYFD